MPVPSSASLASINSPFGIKGDNGNVGNRNRAYSQSIAAFSSNGARGPQVVRTCLSGLVSPFS